MKLGGSVTSSLSRRFLSKVWFDVGRAAAAAIEVKFDSLGDVWEVEENLRLALSICMSFESEESKSAGKNEDEIGPSGLS